MKAGLSLARPTKTTGTTLLQKTVPHGARCPRIEPGPAKRADGRAAPPARRSGPERAAQARPSGSRPGTFGPLTHRCERKPPKRRYSDTAPLSEETGIRSGLYTRSFGQTARRRRLRRRSDGTGSGFWPLFCTVSYSLPIRPKRPRSAARVTRRTGSRNADKIQAIPEHTTARFRKSDVSSAHPLFGFRTDLRGGLFVFAPDAAFAASPDGPVGKPDGEGPAPRPISDTDKALAPFLRSKDTAKPEHARLRTPPQAPGPFPDSGFSPLVMPATCSAPLPVAAHRTQGLSILPGDFSDTGRFPPARPVPRRKGTEKSVAACPIRGGGNRTGNRRTGRGPVRTEADVFRHGEA